MTDDQRAMYAAAIAIRNNEITLRWTRTQLFFLIHSAGISFAFTQLKAFPWPYTASCLLGIGLGVLWFLTVTRTSHWVNYWNRRLVALENASPQPVRVFGGREFIQAERGITTHLLLLSIVCVFLAVWAILLLDAIRIQLGR